MLDERLNARIGQTNATGRPVSLACMAIRNTAACIAKGLCHQAEGKDAWIFDGSWIIAVSNLALPCHLGIPLTRVGFDCFRINKYPGPVLIGIGRVISDEQHCITGFQVGFYAIQSQGCRAWTKGAPAYATTFRR